MKKIAPKNIRKLNSKLSKFPLTEPIDNVDYYCQKLTLLLEKEETREFVRKSFTQRAFALLVTNKPEYILELIKYLGEDERIVYMVGVTYPITCKKLLEFDVDLTVRLVKKYDPSYGTEEWIKVRLDVL